MYNLESDIGELLHICRTFAKHLQNICDTLAEHLRHVCVRTAHLPRVTTADPLQTLRETRGGTFVINIGHYHLEFHFVHRFSFHYPPVDRGSLVMVCLDDGRKVDWSDFCSSNYTCSVVFNDVSTDRRIETNTFIIVVYS
jgi:hypothetical protein